MSVPSSLTNRPTTLVALGASLLLCGCGGMAPPKTIDVWARGLHDREIPSLARFHQMRMLDFTGGSGVVKNAPITDEGLARLAELDLPNLTILHLGYCTNITDAGLAHVGRMHTVRHLSFMASPHVTDRGLPHLMMMKSLTGLDLRACPGITDRGLDILATKTNWLTILLGGCSNISPEGVERLKAVAPEARIAKDDREWSRHRK